MATKPAPQPAAPPAIDPFLRFARTRPFPVQLGSVAAGNSGGQATSLVVWNPNQIPEVPAWLSYLDLLITLPVSVTVPAGATVNVSPYAPYSAFSAQMILAGSPEWPANVSLVPFWLDELTNSQQFDPMGIGPALSTPNTTPGDVPTWFDQGPSVPGFAGGATTVLPGQSITNPGGAPAVTTFQMVFPVRIRFQRKRNKMWGMIPLGDPQNRPQLRMQLNALVGPNPENNLIQDPAASGATAVLAGGGAAINAIFRSKSLDILPQSVQQLAQPLVALGLNLTYDNSTQIQNAGAILYQYQRTAQIYTAIMQLFVNNQAPVDLDYWALWLTQDRASARWEYDAAAGSMQDYFNDTFQRYHRYLPNGVFVADLDGGEFPDIPRETPYNPLMSPDVAYASAVGVAATPNMATAFRIPAGTPMVSAYSGTYTFGLVRVPY